MKMNKMLFGTILALSLTTQSFASCYESYQDSLKRADEIIEGSNYKQALVEGVALSVSTNIVLISALAGMGGPSVSTIGGAGLISAVFLASKYIDLRVDADAKEAFEKRLLLNASINLLKEARVGNGPHLAQALSAINQNISNAISMKDLASTIVAQDEERLLCENDQIMSPAGIISLATAELSTRF